LLCISSSPCFHLLSVLRLYSSHAPPTTAFYTLSLHDALPICRGAELCAQQLDLLLDGLVVPIGVHHLDADLERRGLRLVQRLHGAGEDLLRLLHRVSELDRHRPADLRRGVEDGLVDREGLLGEGDEGGPPRPDLPVPG